MDTLIIILIVVVILIIVAGGIGIWYVIKEDTPVIPDAGTDIEKGTTAAINNGSLGTADDIADIADETDAVIGFANETERQQFISDLMAKPAATSGLLSGFMFVRGADSPGFDMPAPSGITSSSTIEQMAQACISIPGCAGFNHRGFFKSRIYSPQDMTRPIDWATNPSNGMYYRIGVPTISQQVQSTMQALPGWAHNQGTTMYHHDLPMNAAFRRSIEGQVARIAQECENTPGCVGFNTLGYLKNKVFSPRFFIPARADQAHHGMYYRADAVESPAILLYTNTTGTADANTIVMRAGSGTLTDKVKSIHIPRNMAVALFKDDKRLNLRGPMILGRLNVEWEGAHIEVMELPPE